MISKKTVITTTGLLGFASLIAGFYLTFGLEYTLIFAGSLGLLFSLRASAVLAKLSKA